MFKRVLLPTDGSAAALCAAEFVADLAAQNDAHVNLVVAIAPYSTEKTDWAPEVVDRQNAHMREQAELALEKSARPFIEKGVSHATHIIEGDPVSAAIAEETQNGQYDAIAMASRGLGMARSDRNYIGSVTEHVIRRVSIPVLVVPLHKD